jgi:hypothetical protein
MEKIDLKKNLKITSNEHKSGKNQIPGNDIPIIFQGDYVISVGSPLSSTKSSAIVA